MPDIKHLRTEECYHNLRTLNKLRTEECYHNLRTSNKAEVC